MSKNPDQGAKIPTFSQKTHARAALRVPYDKELTLRFANGQFLIGRAVDFSTTGFSLVTGDPARNAFLGQNAFLVQDVQGEVLELSCQVVRVMPNGLAMRFLPD
ncbi:MAG: PilZ domain-containing protein [Magnetococcus sp. DMHC-1]|nr:PilZ domain-containing protein [Magnetococcales bacterium]